MYWRYRSPNDAYWRSRISDRSRSLGLAVFIKVCAWFPARTPDAYVKRIRNEVAIALKDPEISNAMGEQGFAPVGSTPVEVAKVIADEIQTNRRLAAKINLQPE